MPRYNLFLYNQRKRVKYPKTLDLSGVDAAERVARRVANVFTDVVSYWSDLTPDQQECYVIEVTDETGELLSTVPIKAIRKRRLVRLRPPIPDRKKPHQDRSPDGAEKSPEE